MPDTSLLPAGDDDALYTREDALEGLKSLQQRRFVEHYMGAARGNATEAARLAGYSEPSYGRQLLTKSHVKQAIRALTRAETLSRAEVRRRLSQQATATLDDVVDLVDVVHHVWYQAGHERRLTAELTRSAGGADVDTLTPDEAEDLRLLHSYAAEVECSPEEARRRADSGRVHFARVQIQVPVLNLEKARRRGALHVIKEISYDKQGRPEVALHDSQAALKHLDKMYSVADGESDPEAVSRSRLARVSEKMGMQINVLNVNL